MFLYAHAVGKELLRAPSLFAFFLKVFTYGCTVVNMLGGGGGGGAIKSETKNIARPVLEYSFFGLCNVNI